MSTEDSEVSQQRSTSAHKFFLAVLWALFVFSLSLAPWHNTWTSAFFVGLPAALIPTVFVAVAARPLISQMMVGSALMVFCGLNIHQAHGMIEMHFGIFALLALLLFYEDWRVIVASAVVIAVHHLLFSYLQQSGYGVYCMPTPGFGMVLVHAAYVVVESAALSYLAIMLAKKTLNTAVSRAILQQHFHSMRIVAAEAHAGVEAIATASRELAASSGAIASGAHQQATSLEHTSASLEQITAAVRKSADSASEANRLATASGASAEQGGQVLSDAIRAMSEISSASARISDILSTVNEIAFQTNLLAVNAAVEAARAGEQGRGFAVVAAEVRSLALRTTQAAKEIKGLIQDSLSKVERGTALVSRSGETLAAIVQSVKGVGRMVGEIAGASNEQTSGIDQVNAAMAQMDRVTHTNTAETEELAATAQSLSQQSVRLMELVGTLNRGTDDVTSNGHFAAPRGRANVGQKYAYGHARG